MATAPAPASEIKLFGKWSYADVEVISGMHAPARRGGEPSGSPGRRDRVPAAS